MDLLTLKPSEGFQPAFLFNTLQSCHKSPIFVFFGGGFGLSGTRHEVDECACVVSDVYFTARCGVAFSFSAKVFHPCDPNFPSGQPNYLKVRVAVFSMVLAAFHDIC
ncbi:MAG: hypothetical protein JRI36_08300 [Deltaproteobacteria bacterium]|nr:hypothetical protein [Deltaproteobacteria bacterium]